jgi:hypothetical protein
LAGLGNDLISNEELCGPILANMVP